MRNMENLAYFTETMRTAHRMAKIEKGRAVNALTRFLKVTSLSDLEKITQDSKRGAELMAMKTNPSLVDGFVESIDENDKIKVTKKGKIKTTKIGYFFDCQKIV